MIKWILPLALIISVLSPVSKAHEYTVYGIGKKLCGSWTAFRKKSKEADEVNLAFAQISVLAVELNPSVNAKSTIKYYYARVKQSHVLQ